VKSISGRQIARADLCIGAQAADEELAALLKAPQGAHRTRTRAGFSSMSNLKRRFGAIIHGGRSARSAIQPLRHWRRISLSFFQDRSAFCRA